MKRLALMFVLVLGVAGGFAAMTAAAGTPPMPVSWTLSETFLSTGVVGNATFSGFMFGESTSATMASVSWKPAGHAGAYKATDEYTTADGTFLVDWVASCKGTFFDQNTQVLTLACSGNWQVNGGTDAYATLKGTGTFNEVQYINVNDGTGYGSLSATGRMHSN